jgi:predicted PurR-regulated permease PerM
MVYTYSYSSSGSQQVSAGDLRIQRVFKKIPAAIIPESNGTGFISSVHQSTLMHTPHMSDDVKLGLIIILIFTVAIIAFWPLMPVFIWATAIAVALLPIHQRLCHRVKPSVSATLITVWVLLLILLVMSLAGWLLITYEKHIGDMVLTMITGLQNTGLSGFLPSFTEAQLSNFDETLRELMVQTLLSLTGNTMQTLLSIFIFFLSLSMLLYYGEQIWNTASAQSSKVMNAVNRLAEISENTIYALIIVQVSAAIISFTLAIPFFYFLGYGNVLLFSSLVGFAMLIPLIGAQIMILLLALYFLSLGDIRSVIIMLFIGYPLLSGWIDFYYRPVMMGKRVAVHPVIMMIGILAGVPFMGFVGFIVGPVLIALVVTGSQILAEEYFNSCPVTPPS